MDQKPKTSKPTAPVKPVKSDPKYTTKKAKYNEDKKQYDKNLKKWEAKEVAILNKTIKWDLLDKGGPYWTKFGTLDPEAWPQIPDKEVHSSNQLEAWGKGTWTPNNVWVEKKFGDSYEYTEGNTVSVTKGHSQEIIIGGRVVEEKYGKNPEGKYLKRSFFKSGGGKSWTKKWTKTGFLLTDAHTYTTGANYEIKNNLSYNYGAKTNLSMDFADSASLAVKIGASTNNSVYIGATAGFSAKLSASFSLNLAVGAAINISASAAAKIDISASAAAKIAISADAALFLKISAGAGIGMAIEAKPATLTYKLTNGKFKWHGPGTKLEKEATLKAKIEKLTLQDMRMRIYEEKVHIVNQKIKLEAGNAGIDTKKIHVFT